MNQPSDKKTDAESVALEVLQPTALEAQERAHIDMQVATAHRYPRSLEKFQQRAMAMVTLDEETAESCLYRRPVGKEKNDKGQWVEKYAEGGSVRLSEIVAACFGNVRAGSQIVSQDERSVTAQGVAHDLESNNFTSVQVVESTVKSDGTPYSERHRVTIAKAALAKARRDAVFIIVPRALCKKLIDEARKIAIGDATTLESRREKVRAWLKSVNVEDARVFAALSVGGWSDVGLEHLETLTGLKTALKEGDIRIDEAFPVIPKKGEIGKVDGQSAAAAPDPKADVPKVAFEKPYEEIVRRAALDGVTIPQVFEFAKSRKMVGKGAEELPQMANDKMNELLTAWTGILPVIRKIEVKS